MNKIINYILIVVASFVGITYGVFRILNHDIYGSLICFAVPLVMLLPYFFKKLCHINLGNQVETIYYIFIFFSHFLGSVMRLYGTIPGYDKVMHFISGMLSAFLAFLILIKLKQYKGKNLCFNVIFVFAITLAIASLWEFYEFTFDTLFYKDAQNVVSTGVSDTMWDMIAAFLGSTLVTVEYVRESLKHKKLVVLNFIEEVLHS